MRKFKFIFANGQGYGYGDNVKQACNNMKTRKKVVEIGMLVQVIDKGINSYWDGRQFEKALWKDYYNSLKDHTTKVTDGSST